MSDHVEAVQSSEPEAVGRMYDAFLETATAEMPRRPVKHEGRDLIQIGDVERAAKIWEFQTNNEAGYQGTCVLASISQLTRLYGHSEHRENDVVKWAIKEKLCDPPSGNPPNYEWAGGTNGLQAQEIVNRLLKLPARPEHTNSVEQIAERFEGGNGVILFLSGKALWEPNNLTPEDLKVTHAVSVVAVGRDEKTGNLDGFWINDTGHSDPAIGKTRFISAEDMKTIGLVKQGGYMLTIDFPSRPAPSPGV